MPETHNKTILIALSSETTLVPSGVSKGMKNKLQKSDHIMGFLTGHNSDFLELLILAALEEVIIIFNSLYKRDFIQYIQINNVGFQVFTRNCGNCHGMIAKKYDLLLDKVYEQL